MTLRVLPSDGILEAHAGTPCLDILHALDAAGLHAGTLQARHGTLGAALAHGDPAWAQRVMRVEVIGVHGAMASPLAPRSAVGPDLSTWALGAPNPLGTIHLRIDHAEAREEGRFPSLSAALPWLRERVERGVTLAELEVQPGGVHARAVLPRRRLAGAEPPAFASSGEIALCWTTVGYEDVVAAAAAAPARHVLHVLALDTHRAVVSLLGHAGQACASPWHAPEPLPPDIVNALVVEASRA